MKRVISLMLVLLLAVGLAAPAMASEEPEDAVETPNVVLWALDEEEEAAPEEAEEAPEKTQAPEEAPEEEAPVTEQAGMDGALADLARQVKGVLDIGDDYTEFTSDFYDGVAPYWSLHWSDGTRRVNVDVREDGTLLNVNRWDDSGDTDRFYGFDPAFPVLSRQEAEDQAGDWLARLVTEPETARVDSVTTVLGTQGNYRLSGTVEKNGLPSPITFTLCIDGTGLSSFYRSDSYGGYVGELPPAEAAADETAGAEGLAGAAELELRWVSDGENAASLRYVPVGPYTVVDAQSGEAVDMDALYASIGGGGIGVYAKDAAAEEAMAPLADDGAALTEVELASISNYGDVMDQDEIDASLRELTALGLDGFQLQLCSYSMNSDTGDVTAALDYTAPMTGEELYGYTQSSFDLSSDMGLELVIYKYITLDAKTGTVKSVHTTYPLWEKDPEVTMTQAVRVRAAENFLSLAAPELAAQTELCTLKGYSEGDAVTFAQVHEGYFYPDNCLSVTVNPGTGTVDLFTCSWEDGVQFGSAEDVTAAGEAKSAYTDALNVTLGYVAWPVDITVTENERYASLLEQGYTYVEELRLGYYYDNAQSVLGVDALTGEPVTLEETTETVFTYEDLADVPQAAEIEALGQAGVGFAGGSFLPEAELTMREAVTLLLQADGEVVAEGETDDALLERASWRGLVSGEDWAPDESVTRMGFVRMLLGASRYGDAARLLEDAAGEGYRVLAMALGMDMTEPDAVLTRADAAEILYRFMDR